MKKTKSRSNHWCFNSKSYPIFRDHNTNYMPTHALKMVSKGPIPIHPRFCFLDLCTIFLNVRPIYIWPLGLLPVMVAS